MSVRFTQLGPADARVLSTVALESYRQHYLDYWYDRGEWYMQHSFAPERLAVELADPNARYFMVWRHNERAGFLKINLDKPLPDQPANKGLELERIYLLKAATGHGVGQAAVEYVEKLARGAGRQTLWLKAMDTSEALSFYERMGFRHYGTLRLDFPQMKEELRGMVILQKPL